MKNTELEPINEGEIDYIMFSELVQEITGTSLEQLCQNFINHGENYESNME